MIRSLTMRRSLSLLLAVLVGGAACTGVEPPRSFVPAARSLPVEVSVEEVPAEDSWRVGYVLPAEVAGVEFPAGGGAFRAERWGVGLREGEASWHTDGGRERLCFTRPVRAFSAGFRTWEGPPGERPLHVALDGGDRLLSTGHLRIRPLARCDAEGAEPLAVEPEHRFTFATAADRTVRVAGESGPPELRGAQAGVGAASLYVSFGDRASGLEPVEGESAALLLDPGLPAWLREQAAADLPRLLERFAAVTGVPLPVRPLVRVTWGGADAPAGAAGRAASGTVLPGVLLVTVEGAGWTDPDEAARRDAFHALARHTFLLWADGHFPVDAGSGWLAEAAADWFALDAALAFGLRSEEAAARRPIEQANDCLVRLEGRSLREAAAADHRAARSCGALALDVAAGALRRTEPPTDVAQLFRRLFEHAAATGGYGAAAFVAGLRELGADRQAIDDLRRLIATAHESRTELFLQRLLGRAGVEAVPVPPEEAVATPETVAEAVRRAVGRCWCGAEATTSDPGDPGDPASACDPVATGEGVTAVAGSPLGEDPRAAWGHLEAAARGATLTVTLDGLETTLFCGPELFDPTWDALLAPAAPR